MSYKNETVVKIIGVIGALDILTLVLVILKSRELINWPWWLVTAPFWGQFALLIIFAIVFFILYVIAKGIGIIRKIRR